MLRAAHPTCRIADSAFVGPGCVLADSVVLFGGVTVVEALIGRSSYMQAGTQVFNAEIGPFCSIAGGVVIGLARHPTHMVSTHPAFYDNTQPLPKFFISSPVVRGLVPRTTIGADVWIGQNAQIIAGLTIGVGAIVGAGAIVTKNVAPYEIVGGVPATVIRARFGPETCRLIASCWWERSDADLLALGPLFADVEAFLEAVEKT